MSPALAAVCGFLTGTGILLVIRGSQPTAPGTPPARSHLLRRLGLTLTRRQQLLLLTGLVLGILTAALTGWFVALLILPTLALTVPALVLPDKAEKSDIRKIEALEKWTRSLRGIMATGTDLTPALAATLPTAPVEIQPQVRLLVARLQARRPTATALYAFAAELDDPLADMVAAALIIGTGQEGASLSKVLDSLTAMLARKVRSRRQVERARSGPRRSARLVSIVVILGFAGFVTLTGFGQVYHSPSGQLVLLLEVAAFGACLYWMRVRTTVTPTPGFLTPPAAAQLPRPRPAGPASPEPVAGSKWRILGRTSGRWSR